MSLKIDLDMFKPAATEIFSSGLLLPSVASLMPQDKKLNSVIDIAKVKHNTIWVSNGDWSMHELLVALLSITGVANVFISTYALSETPARILSNLKREGMINDLLVIIDNRVDTRTSNTSQLLKSIATKTVLTDTHAKTTIIENDTWKIVVIGSANYTENVRWENGVILFDIEAVEFQKKWFMEALKNGVQ